MKAAAAQAGPPLPACILRDPGPRPPQPPQSCQSMCQLFQQLRWGLSMLGYPLRLPLRNLGRFFRIRAWLLAPIAFLGWDAAVPCRAALARRCRRAGSRAGRARAEPAGVGGGGARAGFGGGGFGRARRLSPRSSADERVTERSAPPSPSSAGAGSRGPCGSANPAAHQALRLNGPAAHRTTIPCEACNS